MLQLEDFIQALVRSAHCMSAAATLAFFDLVGSCQPSHPLASSPSQLSKPALHVTIQSVRLFPAISAPLDQLPVVLCVHGFRSNKDSWCLTMKHITRCCRVLAPDLPCHGDTSCDAAQVGEYISSCVTWLTTFLEALHVTTPIVLVGTSMGGYIAANFAAAHPDRVKHLVLLAPAGASR